MTAVRRPVPGPGPPAADRAGGPVGAPAGTPAGVPAVPGPSWFWALTSALVTLVAGVLVLAWPDRTLHVLAVVVGLYLLVTGALEFAGAFARDARAERYPQLLLAVAAVLAGVLCLRDPLQTVTVLTLVVGVVWLLSGMVTAFAALADPRLPHRGFAFGAALLGVVAGIVVLAVPMGSALVLTRLLGLWLVLLGVAELVVALALRAALRKGRGRRPHAPPPTARPAV
ncbi:hypothetical protein GCM10010358_50880 [Streptomyces minutiscleroticus]|uniref:HdeD family acid-resistance protein n=1 Tax=Streptomyces minutiscleroticus TaxID=68238 RepID=A0A918U4I6_9ACTN|nr:DUF308 domain-containing protein [Streptomyces minutiscleroticus]GGX90703.1 hypothetical protein GCM10010358_50880 [Streptomyces minutiscleroticus]